MRFPVLTLVAPVLTSIILWLITKSPLSLLFAVMGPVAALAQFGDSTIRSRRRQRRNRLREQAEAETAQRDKIFQAEVARRLLVNKWPPAQAWLVRDEFSRPPWFFARQSERPTPQQLRIGLGHGSREPMLISAHHSIAVRGDPVMSASARRALLVQAGWHIGFDVMCELHENRAAWQITVMEPDQPIPAQVRWILDINKRGQARVVDLAATTLGDQHSEMSGIQMSDSQMSDIVDVDLLSYEEFTQLMSVLDLHAKEFSAGTPPLFRDRIPTEPTDVTLAQVPRAGALDVSFGMFSAGIERVDLVAQGPHAVVTGTTGSGKSEFICAWLAALATTYRPEELNLVLIDFKGGTSFAKVADFPHVVGFVTDLTADHVFRASQSLKANIRNRESRLVEAGVTDISMLPPMQLPRLLIVVDEYRTLINQFPAVADVFADIAARGRSLGMHLILSTQRVTGSISETLLANVPMRISFSQLNDADARLFLGSSAPPVNGPRVPGHGVVVLADGNSTEFFSPMMTAATQHRIAECFAAWNEERPLCPVSNLWVPPLPGALAQSEAEKLVSERIPAQTLCFGVAETTDRQSYYWAYYESRADGMLLVTGPSCSGKTSTLRLLAHQGAAAEFVSNVVWIGTAEELWDYFCERSTARFSAPDEATTSLTLIDDWDVLLQQLPAEFQEKILHAVVQQVRTTPTSSLVISCHSESPMRHQLEKLTETMLAFHSRREPGRGSWHGDVIQTFATDDSNATHSRAGASEMSHASFEAFVRHTAQHLIIVTSRAGDVKNRLRVAGLLEFTSGDSTITVREADSLEQVVAHIENGAQVQSNQSLPHSSVPNQSLPQPSTSQRLVIVCDIDQVTLHYALGHMAVWKQIREVADVALDSCSPAEVKQLRLFRGLMPYTAPYHVLVLSATDSQQQQPHTTHTHQRYRWESP